MQERQDDMVKAQKKKKLSCIEWFVTEQKVGVWKTVKEIHDKVDEIGNLLCFHLCDLMFVVS